MISFMIGSAIMLFILFCVVLYLLAQLEPSPEVYYIPEEDTATPASLLLDTEEVYFIVTEVTPEGEISIVPKGSTIDDLLCLCKLMQIEVYSYVYLGEL